MDEAADEHCQDIALVLMVSLVAATAGAAQETGIKSRLASTDYSVRSKAVTELYALANRGLPNASRRSEYERVARYIKGRDSLDVALIDLLEVENGNLGKESAAVPRTEEYTEYYVSVLGRPVAELHDIRAVDRLVGAINTGTIARDGIAALGSAGVAKVVTLAAAPTYGTRQVALDALNRIVSYGEIGVAEKSSIRRTLILGLRDSSKFVRIQALKGLQHFADEEVRALVRKVAESDPSRSNVDGSVVYPIREAAKEWLRNHADEGAVKR